MLLNICQGRTNNAYTCNYNTSLNAAFSDLLCNKQLTQPLGEDNALSLVIGSKEGHSC